MILPLLGLALAGPYANLDADILVQRTVSASPAAVYAVVSDVARYAALIPEDCATDLMEEVPGAWRGTWDLGLLHPRVRVTVTSSEPDRRVDMDHDGTRGWVTRFRISASDQGSLVEAQTYIDLPPRLVRRNYFLKVKPAWEICHGRMLEALGTAAG